MSWHPQHGDGTYGASGASGASGVYHAEHANLADGTLGAYAGNGAYQDGGDTQGLPLVYHPYGDGTVAYDGYVDPAARHGWQDSAAATGDPAHGIAHDPTHRDDGYAHGTDDDQDHAGRDDGSVFVDASGRRSRLIHRAALAVAAVCVVFIGVVIAGFFSPVPSGGVLPWSQEEKPKQEQKHDGSTATDQPGSTARLTNDPSAAPGKSPAPSPSASASKTGDETQEQPTKAPTSTAAPTTSAPGRGNSGDHPGGGQGSTKGPR
ncbi:hypothetical protein [Streptomyces sp. NPDC020681]|uniref:hypothetical protein n=1 Tax=Streptomyces sp. NPDC020681 TaxID=3365083 RepID=UPI0037886643